MISGISSAPSPATGRPNRRAGIITACLACAVLVLCAATGLTAYTLGHRAAGIDQSVASAPATSAPSPAQGTEVTTELGGPEEELRTFVAEHGSLAEQQTVAHVTRIHGMESLDGDFPRVKVFTDYSAPTGDDYEALTAHDNDVALLASTFATWHNQAGEAWLTVYASDGTMLGIESF